MIVRLIVIAVILLVLVGIAAYALWTGADRKRFLAKTEQLNSRLHEIALDHLDVSPVLGTAVVRLKHQGQEYADQVLALAIEHREADPSLSTVLIDEIRNARRTRELG